MDKELQSKLVEIITSIQNAAKSTSDFAISQLPDIVQSYVAYGRAYESIMLAILFFCLVSAIVITIRWEKSLHSYSKGMGYAAGGSVALIFFIIVMFRIKDFLLVWFAPKIWLLTEFANMIK